MNTFSPSRAATKSAVLVLFAAIMVLVAACGKSGGSKDLKDVKWTVAAYPVVQPESFDFPFVSDESYGDVLPLRYGYTPEEAEKLDQLLADNDSLLRAHGYTFAWVEYCEPERKDLVIIPLEPALEQEVELTEIFRMPEYGDMLQVAFRFKDKEQWERVTSANIGRRIAIAVNGRIFNAPQVNCPITQGACSVTIPPEAAATLFPGIDISKL